MNQLALQTIYISSFESLCLFERKCRNLVDTPPFGIVLDGLPKDMLRSEPPIITQIGYISPILPARIPLNSAFSGRLIKGPYVDVEPFTSWISFCKRHHGKCCNAPTRKVSTALKAIDCKTRQVIQAPAHCQYSALSYVWGSANFLPL
jgi:hypothetical protein